MPDSDPIAVSYSTLDGLKSQVGHLSSAFTNTLPAVQGTEGQLTSGAQQFAAQLQLGAAAFTLAWTAGLSAMAEGSALISNNIGQASLDFEATDVAASSDYVL